MPAEKISIEPPPGLPANMVAEYVQRCLEALPAAKLALDGLDHNYLRVYGHGLKGSGGGYGIPVLTEIGSSIQEAARRGDNGVLRDRLVALEVYLHRVEILAGR
jgi:hypothetical protein